MDFEREITSLKAETLALSALVGFLLIEMRRSETLTTEALEAIFENGLKLAEQTLLDHPHSSASVHAAKAGRIIEDLRAQVLG